MFFAFIIAEFQETFGHWERLCNTVKNVQYCGGCSVMLKEGIISYLGDIISAVGDILYCRGKPKAL